MLGGCLVGAWVSASPTAGAQWVHDLGCDFGIPASTTLSFVSSERQARSEETPLFVSPLTILQGWPVPIAQHPPPDQRSTAQDPRSRLVDSSRSGAAEALVYTPLALAQPCVSFEWSPRPALMSSAMAKKARQRISYGLSRSRPPLPSLGPANPARGWQLQAVDVFRNLPVGTRPSCDPHVCPRRRLIMIRWRAHIQSC